MVYTLSGADMVYITVYASLCVIFLCMMVGVVYLPVYDSWCGLHTEWSCYGLPSCVCWLVWFIFLCMMVGVVYLPVHDGWCGLPSCA